MELYYKLGTSLTKEPVLYPMKRMSMKKFTLSKGQQTFTFNDVAMSAKKPDRLLLAFTPESWWEGGLAKYPLQSTSLFSDDGGDEGDPQTMCRMTSISLTINSLMIDPIKTKNHQQLVMSGYDHLIKNLGLESCYDRALSFNYMQYARQNFYILFDLTQPARAHDPSVRYATREGQLRLEMEFSRTLPVTVNAFVLAEYNASVQIDKNRNVVYNFLA